jgi:predicted TIM-barrel fold metal-dependent hydrolase
LIVGGGFARYPDIRFIFSHGGGMLLPIVNRISTLVSAMSPEQRQARVPNGMEYELQRQHYDLASIGFNAPAMEGLRKLLPVSQMLYGSDEPFNSTVRLFQSVDKLGFSENELTAVKRENAVRLFPRFRT